VYSIAKFNAVTLLVGQQKGQPACKNTTPAVYKHVLRDFWESTGCSEKWLLK